MIELPVIEPPTKLRHSYSRISTFHEICELEYALDAVMPRPPASAAMLRGTHVHEVADAAAGMIIYGLDVAAALGSAALSVDGPLSPDKLAPYVDRLSEFFQEHTPAKGGVEFWVDDLEWNGQKASDFLTLPWCGKVDLRDTDDCLNDYKTIGNWHKVQTSAQARRSLQLRSYCLATGLRKARYVWLNPNFPLAVTEVEYTDAELGDAFDKLVHLCLTAEHRWKHGGWTIAGDHPLCTTKWCDWHKKGCRGRAADIQGVLDSADAM